MIICGGTMTFSKHITQLIFLQNTFMKQACANMYLLLKTVYLHGTLLLFAKSSGSYI